LEKKVTPPFIPNVKDEKDHSHFDPLFTKSSTADEDAAPVSPEENARFKNFDVSNDNDKPKTN